MEGLLARLGRGDLLVGDGAWGTQLMQRGLPEGRPPEWFALERPDLIEEVARLYVAAGADLVTTDTFGGSAFRLKRHGLEAQLEGVNREAVQAVKRAAAGRALVSASVGPTGEMLEPYGDVEPEAAEDAFAEQMAVLALAGADLFCIETMADLTEAACAVRAARRVAPSLPVVATMTFEPSPRGLFTLMGTSAEDAAKGLVDAGADVVGSNCGTGIADMIAIARAMTGAVSRPVAIQPNAGLPETVDGRLVYRETAQSMAARVPELLALGVRIVGSCCGTTPEHTRAIRAVVDGWRADRG
jgi:5-methyltetrahydrofolate--homocysteine methyltransferase